MIITALLSAMPPQLRAGLVVASHPDSTPSNTLIQINVASNVSAQSSLTGTWNNGGGNANIIHTTTSGLYTSFYTESPSSAGTYQLTVNAPNHTPATTSTINVSAQINDFNNGIYGPTTLYWGYNQSGYNDNGAIPIGSYFTRGLIGPTIAELSGPDAAAFVISPGPGGYILTDSLGSDWPYQSDNPAFNITVTITDSVDTSYSTNVIILNPSSSFNTVAVSTNLVLDSQVNQLNYWGNIQVALFNFSYGAGDYTFIADPDNIFSATQGHYGIEISPANLISANIGSYNVTIIPTGGPSFTLPLWIGHESIPNVAWQPSNIYTSTPPTNGYGSNQIGTLLAVADSGIKGFELISNPTEVLNTYSIDPFYGRSGYSYLLNSTSDEFLPGICNIMSQSGLGTNLIFNLPTISGNTVSSSNMTGNIVLGLTNFLLTANAYNAAGIATTVLTIDVDGISPDWDLTILDVIDDNCQLTNGLVFSSTSYVPRYNITGSGSTATITAWNLSAIDENTPQTDQLKITITDGNGNFCSNVFNITTSWHTCAVSNLSVGPGGTWTTANDMFQALWDDPALYAGANVKVLYGIAGAGDWNYGFKNDPSGYLNGSWPCPIHLYGDTNVKATFTGSISNGSGGAGNILTVSSSTGITVEQWINSGIGVANATYITSHISGNEWYVSGPSQFVSNTTMTTSYAQIPLDFEFQAPGGSNQGGLMVSGGYDIIFENLEIYNVSNSNLQGDPNAAGIYRTNEQSGNATLRYCYIHNCDMGWENGDYGNHLYFYHNLFAACGNGYQGSSHNFYTDGAAEVTFMHNYSVDSQCHEFKTRAMIMNIYYNYFLEGMNWWGFDTPFQNAEGGILNFYNNVVMKGTDGGRANNGNTIEWANEVSGHPAWYKNILNAGNNTIINTVTTYEGIPNQPAVGWNAIDYDADPVRNLPYQYNITNTNYYNLAESQWALGTYGATAPTLGSGQSAITNFPFTGISLINPYTGGAPYRLPIWASVANYNLGYIASAPGTYNMIMTLPINSPNNTPITGGLLSAYDSDGGQITDITASLTGGSNEFALTTLGNTVQLSSNVSNVNAGIYSVQVSITGTSATEASMPNPEYLSIIVGNGYTPAS